MKEPARAETAKFCNQTWRYGPLKKGMWYKVRLGKPLPLSNLRSEWFDEFLKEVNRHRVGAHSIRLWSLGGAGVILKTAKSTIYVNPYCGGSVVTEEEARRMIPIPFNASDVRRIDATVITHEDLDHLNEDFILPISKNTSCPFIGPPSVADILKSWGISEKRVICLEEYEEKKVNDVRITATPSNDPNAETANTYIFEVDGIRIFHAGDSIISNRLLAIGKKYDVDIVLVSLGQNPPGETFYNNPGEALQIARDLKAKIVIPMHWDLWAQFYDDPHNLQKEARLRRSSAKVVVLKIGEKFDYP